DRQVVRPGADGADRPAGAESRAACGERLSDRSVPANVGGAQPALDEIERLRLRARTEWSSGWPGGTESRSREPPASRGHESGWRQVLPYVRGRDALTVRRGKLGVDVLPWR